jgi:prepilin-type N-terminal cleavage/methylation domain-containing protein
MSHRRAFTLIELLISITLGVLMLSLAMAALVQVKRSLVRSKALIGIHAELAQLNAAAGRAFRGLHQPARFAAEADQGSDGSWGTGDEKLSLTWMSTTPHVSANAFRFDADRQHELIWCRLEYRTAPNGRGMLWYGESRGQRQVVSGTIGSTIELGTTPRRDRRRDLDDNDLRLIEGASPAFLGTLRSLGLTGDATELATQMRPLLSPTIAVQEVAFAWVDGTGHGVHADQRHGLTLHSSARADPNDGYADEVAWPTAASHPQHAPWANARRVVLDGTWLDGRGDRRLADAASGLPAPLTTGAAEHHVRTPVGWLRPAVIRLSCTLIETESVSGDIDPERHVRLPVRLSIPLTTILGPP